MKSEQYWGRWLDEDQPRDFRRENPRHDDGEDWMRSDEIEALIRRMAAEAQSMGRGVHLSFGVDAEVCGVIATMPDAHVSSTVYVRQGEEPYVIRGAEVKLGACILRAQDPKRPATSTEVESAGRWSEHEHSYRAGTLGARR